MSFAAQTLVISEDTLMNAWLLLSESGPSLHPASTEVSKLILQYNCREEQIVESLQMMFSKASTMLSEYTKGYEAPTPIRLFSMCALMSQLGDPQKAFNLSQGSKSDVEQSVGMVDAVIHTKALFDELQKYLATNAKTLRAHELRKRTLALAFGKSLFVSTLDTSYAQAFGKRLEPLLRQTSWDASSDDLETRKEWQNSSRLAEMWMHSSQCCKYGTLLRMRAQVLLLSETISAHLSSAYNGIESSDIPETVRDLQHRMSLLTREVVPSHSDDSCNRGTFYKLRSEIVDNLIEPCCNPRSAVIIANALERVGNGAFVGMRHLYMSPSRVSIVELASILFGDGKLSAVTSMGLSLTIMSYGLLGNRNVHTRKKVLPPSTNWRQMAYEDKTLHEKANHFTSNLKTFDSDSANMDEQEANENAVDVQEAVENQSEDGCDSNDIRFGSQNVARIDDYDSDENDGASASVTRWTPLRKQEQHEIEAYSQIFIIDSFLFQHSAVQQLRSLTRAYFSYAISKASQASEEAQHRSWFGAASSTYRGLLTAPELDEACICPSLRNPDSRRPLFLQCATLVLLEQAVNDMQEDGVHYEMSRLETQLDALAFFNKALFDHLPHKNSMLSNERSEKRWAAKTVGSFTPMLTFVLSGSLKSALLDVFEQMRTHIRQGTMNLDPLEDGSDYNFPDVHELMGMLKTSANRQLTELATKVMPPPGVEQRSFLEKKALQFAVGVQRELWNMSPTSDGWVNILHFRAGRSGEKRSRAELEL